MRKANIDAPMQIAIGQGTPQYSLVQLTPPSRTPQPANLLQVGYRQLASVGDLETGLAIALEQRYLSPTDPILSQLRNFLALAYNGTPIIEAAQQSQVSLAVVMELGKLAIEARTKQLLRRPPASQPHH